MEYLNRAVSLPQKSSFFLFGPRQVGKSTLIRHRFIKKIWEINLLLNDIFILYSSDLSSFRKEALHKIKKNEVDTIFVDEVQRLPELLNEVQYLMQECPDVQFILSGSSARKLKRGGANLLGGRAVERFLFPMIYSEIKKDFDLDLTLSFGTLPAILQMQNEDKIDILTSYVSTYLKEEIQAEGIVRNLGGFSRFLDVAANQFGELINYSSIARECRLPASTVQSYYQILEDTLIGLKLEPWSKSIRHRLSTHPKFYFFDTGVVNAINKCLRAQITQPLKGRLFEQWIILETYRNIKYKKSEANLFFWRTGNNAEVDLVVEQHGKIIAAIEIKSKTNISSADLSGLKSFKKVYQDVPSYVISTVKNSYELDDILVLSWQDYLDNALDKFMSA